MSNFTLHDTILYVENLSVKYGDKTILKDVSFEEKDVQRDAQVTGQTIAVLGRSGRGKSTLFKALTGLIKPDSGKVLIRNLNGNIDGSAEVLAKEVSEGDVGFVDQKYTLFRHKTVYQALQFALRNNPSSASEKHERIMSLLAEWGLEKMKDQYPNELSGGQRQRTAILEQVLSSGHYLVMDEPFSGLDIGNVDSVKNTFKKIVGSHELNTLIFSTHDIELAVELADSIYILGYPTKEDKQANYGSIVGHFDLKQQGIAWQDFGVEHLALCKEIKNLMLES